MKFYSCFTNRLKPHQCFIHYHLYFGQNKLFSSEEDMFTHCTNIVICEQRTISLCSCAVLMCPTVCHFPLDRTVPRPKELHKPKEHQTCSSYFHLHHHLLLHLPASGLSFSLSGPDLSSLPHHTIPVSLASQLSQIGNATPQAPCQSGSLSGSEV